MMKDMKVIKVEQVGGGLPDIDVDVAQGDRDRVINYLRNKFEDVYHIANFSYMKPKAAFKAAARALGLSFGVSNVISKEIPEEELPSFEEFKKSSDVINNIEEEYIPKIKEAFELAKHFLGRIDHVGVHASGIALVKNKRVPVMVAKDKNTFVTQYDMYTLEKLGVLKQDILGLRTLDVIKNTIDLVEENVEFDYKDEAVFNFIKTGDLYGVFQLEREETQEVCHKADIKDIFDLASVLAVIRPGSADAKVGDKTFLDIFLEGGIKHDIEELNEILARTKGVLLFQEQQMEICQRLAGFSLSEADDIRKAIGKKNKELLDKYESRFIEGMTEKGYSIERAKDLWQWFTAAAYYSFNLSHAISYSLITYQTAYLKYYYPLEYMTSLLNSFIDNKEKRVVCINKIKSMGIELEIPSISDLHYEAKIKDGKIILGFGFIEGLGSSQYKGLEKNGPYESVYDFIVKKPCNNNVMRNIIKSGALDVINKNRKSILNRLEKDEHNRKLFESDEDQEMNIKEISLFEEEVFGVTITSDLEDILGLDLFPNSIDKVEPDNEDFVAILSELRHGTTKYGKPYTAMTLRGRQKVLPRVFYWGGKFTVKETPTLVRVRGSFYKDYFKVRSIESINR